ARAAPALAVGSPRSAARAPICRTAAVPSPFRTAPPPPNEYPSERPPPRRVTAPAPCTAESRSSPASGQYSPSRHSAPPEAAALPSRSPVPSAVRPRSLAGSPASRRDALPPRHAPPPKLPPVAPPAQEPPSLQPAAPPPY